LQSSNPTKTFRVSIGTYSLMESEDATLNINKIKLKKDKL